MVCWGDRRHQSVWEITETGVRDNRREDVSLSIIGGALDTTRTKTPLKPTHLMMIVVMSMCYVRGSDA